MARKTFARIEIEEEEIESIFTFPPILERKDLALYFKIFKTKYFL